MSARHPIIAVTGSSGAGTTTVSQTFEQIFWRENVSAVFVEGDSFHRFTRAEMIRQTAAADRDGKPAPTHFGPEGNDFEGIEALFKGYAETGRGRVCHYLHDEVEAAKFGVEIGRKRRGIVAGHKMRLPAPHQPHRLSAVGQPAHQGVITLNLHRHLPGRGGRTRRGQGGHRAGRRRDRGRRGAPGGEGSRGDQHEGQGADAVHEDLLWPWWYVYTAGSDRVPVATGTRSRRPV